MVGSPSALGEFAVVVFGAAVILFALALVAILWRTLWMALFAAVARTVYRFGLYEPSTDVRTTHNRKRDSGFLVFSKVLRAASRLVPGDPNRHPHTFILPMFFIGIPAFGLLFALLWGVPLYLLWQAANMASGTLTIALAFVGTFVYIGVVVMALKLLARIPSLVPRFPQLR